MRSRLKKIAIGLFVLLVLVCAGVPTLLWSIGGGRPNIAVDYVAKLNEDAASVPEDERAWPGYRDASIALAEIDESEMMLLGDPDRWASEAGSVESAIAMIEEQLETIRASAGKPGLGYVTTEPQPQEFWEAIGQEAPDTGAEEAAPPMAMMVLLPHLSELREFARLLNADAWVAARQNNGDRFVADIEALLGVAAHADEHSTLINQLVGIAIRALTYGRILETVSDHPDLLDAEQLACLQSTVAALHGSDRYRLDMSGERYFFLDVVQRVYTDDGQGNGVFTAHGYALLEGLDGFETPSGDPSPGARIASGAVRLVAADRAKIVGIYDDLLADAEAWGEIPLWERPVSASERWAEIEAASEGVQADPGMMMLSMLVPALSKAHLSADRINQERDAVVTALAITRWRAEHGAWPASLDEVVPGLLPTLPADSFSGQPLMYRVVDGSPVLYSIGMDRDDDGGRNAEYAFIWVAAEQAAARVAEDPASHDGDWVFLGKSEASSDEDASSD